jgi:hypothetical protein
MTLAILIAVGLIAVVYQGYISWRVWASEVHSVGQKLAQLGIVWLQPIVGAGIVHWIDYGQARSLDAPSGKYFEAQRYEDHDTNPRIFND